MEEKGALAESELSFVREDTGLLREAESVARWGVEITADANPEDLSSCLFELARTLETVGLRTGRSDYLREAVANGPPGHSMHARHDREASAQRHR